MRTPKTGAAASLAHAVDTARVQPPPAATFKSKRPQAGRAPLHGPLLSFPKVADQLASSETAIRRTIGRGDLVTYRITRFPINLEPS